MRALFGENVCENERIGSQLVDLRAKQTSTGIKGYTFILSKDLNITIKRCCHTCVYQSTVIMEGIVLICSIGLCCVIAIFNGHR